MGDFVGRELAEADPVDDGEPDIEEEGVIVAVLERVADPDMVAEADCVGRADAEDDEEAVADPDAVALAETDEDAEAEPEAVALAETDEDAEAEPEAVALADALADAEGVGMGFLRKGKPGIGMGQSSSFVRRIKVKEVG